MGLCTTLLMAVQMPLSINKLTAHEPHYKNSDGSVIVINDYYDDIFIEDYYENVILDKGSYLYDEIKEEFTIISTNGKKRIYRKFF